MEGNAIEICFMTSVESKNHKLAEFIAGGKVGMVIIKDGKAGLIMKF